MKVDVPLAKKTILTPLRITVVASAIDTVIQMKIYGPEQQLSKKNN